MAITKEQVLDALRNVEDPDLKRDLVTLDMIKNLDIEGQRVSFTVELTTPSCPMKDTLHKACVTAVQTLVDPQAEVDVEMTANVTAGRQAEEGDPLPYVKNIIAVASGKGGVGKSTVAANMAIALAKDGAKVGLLDADIYGPSVPTLMGLDGQQPQVVEEEGKNKMIPLTAHNISVNSIGFLVPPGQAVVWRGPMASNALKQLFTDTKWGELDYLLVDLPPGTGDLQITIAQQMPLTGALIVTTPQEVALTDVRKAIAMLISQQIQVPVLGIIENMAYFTPSDLPDRKYYLFGHGGGQTLASEYNLPLLGSVPIVEALREGSDAGQPAALQRESIIGGAFDELARATAQQIAIRNEEQRQEAAV